MSFKFYNTLSQQIYIIYFHSHTTCQEHLPNLFQYPFLLTSQQFINPVQVVRRPFKSVKDHSIQIQKGPTHLVILPLLMPLPLCLYRISRTAIINKCKTYALLHKHQCLGCKHQCLGCKHQCLGCKQQCLECKHYCLGCKHYCLECKHHCLESKDQCLGCKHYCLGCKHQCLGCKGQCLL